MEQATNSLTSEMEAMAAIGRALGDLTDLAARQRVLRWACERFAADAAPATAAAPAVACVATQPDADLEVDNLTEMFSANASATDDDSLSLEPRAAVVEVEKSSVETVLRSFAADFRAFADDWNGAAA